jgi:osomolarity two-component system response regulator SSK1
VLIVDDNPINQTILSTFMKKKKIKYDVAKNGEEAVQKWRTGGFHLILMDIQMPVMDGIQATKEIRLMEKMNSSAGFPLSTPRSEGRTPSEAPSSGTSTSSPYRSSVIIVALTASSLQSDRVAALAAGCNDFLTKPVSLQWLNNKIIEWGSIKALQMWADLRPEVVKSISTGQVAQAHKVARGLHVPEGRITPSGSPSRSSSRPRTTQPSDAPLTTPMAPSSIGSSTQAPHFPAKDDFSDSPSSDNLMSDFEPPRPARSEVAAAITTTGPPSISLVAESDQFPNIDSDIPKPDEEPPSTSDQIPVIPVI